MNEFNLKKVFKWQQASKPIVKKYVADLHQTGTDAPVATELYNDTDVSFTYEYITVGTYAVYASKPIFTGCGMGCQEVSQKTQVTLSNGTFLFNPAPPKAGVNYNMFAVPVANDVMIIVTTDTTQHVDGYLGQYLSNNLEITIYP